MPIGLNAIALLRPAQEAFGFWRDTQDGLSFAGADICADVCFWHQADIGSQQMSAFGGKADIKI